MSGIPNYYQILLIPENATFEQIRKAFREQAKLWHPDTNKGLGAKDHFQLINEAWQVLKDDEKRKRYDLRLRYLKRGAMQFEWQVKYEPVVRRQAVRRPVIVKDDPPPTRFETITDIVLFGFLGLAGLLSIIFGVRRLFFEPLEGHDGIVGIVLGIVVIALLGVGWYFLKLQNKNKSKS